MPASAAPAKPFHVELIKPSHYDDDGYVIQWRVAFIPSNSLGAIYAFARDIGERQALGTDVDVRVSAYDEIHTVIPKKAIIDRIRKDDGVVLLVGVQSNQFPRAMDLAREFLEAGVKVVVGGFHVSGCLSMLPDLPPDLKEAQDLGVTFFAGEAEGRLEALLRDAINGELKPVYDYLADLPDMRDQIAPYLPEDVTQGYQKRYTSFDAGRGCPFQCSFCTIINVQGHKSRFRSADDVEKIIRANVAEGRRRFFLTDDDFARNANWEAILDRLIEIREGEGINLKFILQVDTQSHKIPNFVVKARRAGCDRVFLGLENINPANLKAANKAQNKITDYRKMMLAWRAQGVLTYAGYILGFPEDTPESIERDIAIIKKELPIDLLEFFILTPLPGSADHQALYKQGVWMDPDMNKYDLEHATTAHPKMSIPELNAIYRKAWDLYYTPDHVETLIRRAGAIGPKPKLVARMIFQFHGSVVHEGVHPLQGGLFRRKLRRDRRSDRPRESPFVFYPRRAWEMLSTYIPAWWRFRGLEKLRKRVEADPARAEYTDSALAPADRAEWEDLEMYTASESARAAVERVRTTATRREAAAAARATVKTEDA